MRIVAKIATAGTAALSRFPLPNAEIEDCLTADGRLDEAKARKALDVDQIQIASTDDRRVVAFAMEYLKQTRAVVEHLAASLGPGEASAVPDTPHERGYRTEAATEGDRRCDRNMRKGRFAFVRTDIYPAANGLRVRLTVQNPRAVVGNAENFAHEYAVMCARILRYLRENITTATISLVEGEGAAGVYDEAAELDRRCDLQRVRRNCPNRTETGYCSPICPDCPLYKNGKCLEP